MRGNARLRRWEYEHCTHVARALLMCTRSVDGRRSALLPIVALYPITREGRDLWQGNELVC